MAPEVEIVEVEADVVGDSSEHRCEGRLFRGDRGFHSPGSLAIADLLGQVEERAWRQEVRIGIGLR
ncbi:MAG: hypothetical protein HYR89_06395 [Actinobacteria bacterium]|nr:hypothetical protein [Actinomycetota bacterium]